MSEEIKTFTYNRTDLIDNIPPWSTGVKLSVFDYLLHQTWDNKMRQPDNGPFLYPLDSIVKLMPPGKHKYQGVFCPSRSTNKRSPPKEAENPKVLVPFNKDGFHFNKIPKSECLFRVQHVKIGVTSDILLNNAPYERCHSLLITEMEKNKNQVISYEGLVAALEIAFLSTHPGIRILYNSLGACASVNQQHFQIYYTSTYQLPIDIVDLKPLLSLESTNSNLNQNYGTIYKMKDSTLPPSTTSTTKIDPTNPNQPTHPNQSSHPGVGLPAFVIKGINSVNLTTVVNQIIHFTDFLVEQNIPHNMCISRDHVSGELTIFIWCRKFQTNRIYTDFNVAVTELIGHCYYGSREQFDSHTEADIEEAMRDMRLDKEIEDKIEKFFINIFDPNSRGIMSAIFGWF